MSEHTQPGRQEIAAYDYGRSVVAHSPVTLDELHEIEQTIGWSGMDTETLRRHEASSSQAQSRWLTSGEAWSVRSHISPNGSSALTEGGTMSTGRK